MANRPWMTRRTLLAACIGAELLIDTVAVTMPAARGDVTTFFVGLMRLALMGGLCYLLWRGHIWAGWIIAAFHAITAVGSVLLGVFALRAGESAGSLVPLAAIAVFFASFAGVLVWLLLTHPRRKPPPLPVAAWDDPADGVPHQSPGAPR